MPIKGFSQHQDLETEIQVNGQTEYGPSSQPEDSTYDISVDSSLDESTAGHFSGRYTSPTDGATVFSVPSPVRAEVTVHEWGSSNVCSGSSTSYPRTNNGSIEVGTPIMMNNFRYIGYYYDDSCGGDAQADVVLDWEVKFVPKTNISVNGVNKS